MEDGSGPAGAPRGAMVLLDTGVGAASSIGTVAFGAVSRTMSMLRGRAGTRIALGAAGAAVDVVRQAVEPWRVRGSVVRVRAMTDARDNLPSYVGSAVDRTLDIVSVDEVIGRVDIDALIRRVDIDALIQRVDIDALIARVDLNRLIQRLDINGVVARVDVDALVERTDLGAVIAQSTGGVASGAVDLVRRQGVGLDGWVAGLAARMLRRDVSAEPAGPPMLAGGGAP